MPLSIRGNTLPETQERLIAQFGVVHNANPHSAEERESVLAAPRFGTAFTDHMARISWTRAKGWHDEKIVPYGPIALDPATAVLHYAQEVFEGLKAYRHPDGTIWTFRPNKNARRFNKSAERLALPQLPTDLFVAACAALVRIDSAWVPSAPDSSLYLRPFMFASEPFLGVRAADQVEFLVIASPAGAYFAGGVHPVSIWVDGEYHRAAPGGTGGVKAGGNYAASLLPQQLAAAKGFDQVLYLSAANDGVEELGGMNLIAVRKDGTVETPPLTGSILEGVTRDSLLTLAADRGHRVEERKFTLAELVHDIEAGDIVELFACGTAAVVTPIGRLAGKLPDAPKGERKFDVRVADGQPGKLTMELREELTGIQYGLLPDRHHWLTRLVWEPSKTRSTALSHPLVDHHVHFAHALPCISSFWMTLRIKDF